MNELTAKMVEHLAEEVDDLEVSVETLYGNADAVAHEAGVAASSVVRAIAVVADALALSSRINVVHLRERLMAEERYEESREKDRAAVRGAVDEGFGALEGTVATLWRIGRRLPGWIDAERAELEAQSVEPDPDVAPNPATGWHHEGTATDDVEEARQRDDEADASR